MTSSCMKKAIVKPRPTPTLYGRSAWQDAVNSIRTIPEKQKRPVSMPPDRDSMQRLHVRVLGRTVFGPAGRHTAGLPSPGKQDADRVIPQTTCNSKKLWIHLTNAPHCSWRESSHPNGFCHPTVRGRHSDKTIVICGKTHKPERHFPKSAEATKGPECSV